MTMIMFICLVVIGCYLLYMEYKIIKFHKQLKDSNIVLYQLIKILDNQGIIILKEVGEDE